MSRKPKQQEPWLAEEQGTVRKDWRGRVRIALAFPNRYAVGMSNLGFQSVYGAFNRIENVVCERVFYPEPQDLSLLQQSSGKLLSVESHRPVRDFDLFVFSIPFENDYTHVLEMLALAGIAPRSQDRTQDDPFVAAGGVAVFLNPEPLAPFLDFLFIGEAEALLPDFWAFWDTKRPEGGDLPRRDYLKALAGEVAGIYVPSLYEASYLEDGTLDSLTPLAGSGAPERVVYRRADLAVSAPCQTVLFTPHTEFSNVSLIEIGRGCGRGCRFCAAGYVYRPVRYHAAEKLLEAAQFSETSRIGLVSAAVSDHPQVSVLCRSLLDMGGSLSFSSLRADTITPEILTALQSSGHQAVAIAPEAGSERLRQVINKNLSLEQIYNAVEQLTERGILHLKLYFMIGLPTETLDDLEAIVEMTKGIKHHVLNKSRGLKRMGTITLSIHSFVPKAFTPFQWVAFAGVRELKERALWIRKALQKVPNVRVHFDLPKWAYVQALLARGDRRAAQFIEKVALDGFVWTQAMRSVPFNPDFWVMRERGRDEAFPWEVIDQGLKRSYLWEEYQRALQGQSTPPCRPEEKCRRCGACAP